MTKIFSLIVGMIILSPCYAHQMGLEIKLSKIKEALKPYSRSIASNKIIISPNPFAADLELQLSRLESGDKDIESISVDFYMDEQPHKVECDFLTGEYGRKKAIYFTIYKNCQLTNLENYKSKEIKLSPQFWNDWKY